MYGECKFEVDFDANRAYIRDEIKAFIQQESTDCKAFVVDSKNEAIDFYKNANFIAIENYSDDDSIVFMIKKNCYDKRIKKKKNYLMKLFKIIMKFVNYVN